MSITMTETGFRQLNLIELDQSVEVISQAFIDDPLCVYMLPNKRTRLETLRKFFHLYATIYLRNGKGYGVGDPLKGVAFWLEPGGAEVSLSIGSLGLFLPVMFTHYPIGYLRARQIIKQTELMHKQYASAAHFYLDNLAVLPSVQGQGFASQLVRPILELADAQQVVAYTDTVTPANVSLYRHFGFQVMEEHPVEHTEITVWALRRSPQQ
jgi:ribosomal protein S18 acetylase RimI-like enzyme